MLSLSHVPLKQRTEVPPEHVPLFGIAAPVTAFATQACVPVSHQLAELQSSSTLQPPETTQKPFAEHAPLRQTTAALPLVHAPALALR